MLQLFKQNIIDVPEAYRPRIEELPGDLRRVAEAVESVLPEMGVRLTLILAQGFPGQHMYFRSVKEILINYRDEAMRSEYDLGNITAKELATRTGLSLGHVEKILARAGKEVEDRQMKLFERGCG